MPCPVVLPRLAWGDPASPRTALLVHGLGSSAALMWRFGVELAERGWHAVAVDLRGHGDAPRALDYRIEAFAADLAATAPDRGDAWDLVLGHSLGGAASAVAAAGGGWTRQLVLVDPAIALEADDVETVAASQRRAFDDNTLAAVRATYPHFHEQDLELKVDAVARASRWAVEQAGTQNAEWDVRAAAARLDIPTHVIAADPAVFSIFRSPLADEVLRNPHISMSVVSGAGHSPHRDRPDETMRHLREAIA